MSNRTCSVIENGIPCQEPHQARGYCSKHYCRWRTNGDPLVTQRVKGDDEARFWSYVDRRGDGECWPWTGETKPDGYARFGVNGRLVYVHRWAYEHFVGPIPEGYEIDHVRANGCTRKDCVNYVRHLEAVTKRENRRRSDSPAAINARKTHCIRGHELTPENIWHPPAQPNRRKCRACRKVREN